MLGYEGKGSLLSYLRKKLWATELNAWVTTNHELFSFFDINICLTENGFDHLDDVLATVFSYLKFVQLAKFNETSFHEFREAFANVHRFAGEPDAFANVKYLQRNMLLYPSKFMITAVNYFYDFDVDAVRKSIDYLNSRKFNIMITLKRSKRKQMVYNSTEPWFGIKYAEMDMPAKWIELHRKAKPFPEFTLPGTNPFITDNFTILNIGGDEKSTPYSLIYNGSCELWYRENNEISRPYAEFYLYFLKPRELTSIDK